MIIRRETAEAAPEPRALPGGPERSPAQPAAGEPESRAGGLWQPLTTVATAAEASPPAERGPRWLVTVLDFVERATGRTTSLREHLVMFVVYAFGVIVVPVVGAAYLVTRMIASASWPGMTIIGMLAASAGVTLFLRRLRQESSAETANGQPVEGSRPDAPAGVGHAPDGSAGSDPATRPAEDPAEGDGGAVSP